MDGKRLTPTEVVAQLAARTGLSAEQVKSVLRGQAELAYAESAAGFPIPGIGLLHKVERPARNMIMRFGPMAGQEVTVPSSRLLKFRISRLAKDMVMGDPRPLPDIFKEPDFSAFTFSVDATELADPSMFLADLGGPFELARGSEAFSISVYRLPDLRLPTGEIVAADGIIGEGNLPFRRTVPPGQHALALVMASVEAGKRVALAVLRFGERPVARWEMALCGDRDASTLKAGEIVGYGVDSGTGSFSDASVTRSVVEIDEDAYSERVQAEMRPTTEDTWQWLHMDTPNGSRAIFSSGGGDGSYASYFGLDEAGNAVALVTDFKILKWGPVAGS